MRAESVSALFILLIGVLLTIVCVVGAFNLSPSRDDAIKAVEDEAYTDIELGDAEVPLFDGCSPEDSVLYRGRARDSANARVSLIVCCGAMKTCSVRAR